MAMSVSPVDGEYREIKGLLKLFKMPTSSRERGVNTKPNVIRKPQKSN